MQSVTMKKLTLYTREGLRVAVLHSMRSGESRTSFIWILIAIQIHANHCAREYQFHSYENTEGVRETGLCLKLIGYSPLRSSSPSFSHQTEVIDIVSKNLVASWPLTGSDIMWTVWDPYSGAQGCALLCPRHRTPLVSAVPHHTSPNTGGNKRIEQQSKLEITEQHLCESMCWYSLTTYITKGTRTVLGTGVQVAGLLGSWFPEALCSAVRFIDHCWCSLSKTVHTTCLHSSTTVKWALRKGAVCVPTNTISHT